MELNFKHYVYFMEDLRDEDEYYFYIGETKDMKKRMLAHRFNNEGKLKNRIMNNVRVSYIEVDNMNIGKIMEKYLIYKYRPSENVNISKNIEKEIIGYCETLEERLIKEKFNVFSMYESLPKTKEGFKRLKDSGYKRDTVIVYKNLGEKDYVVCRKLKGVNKYFTLNGEEYLLKGKEGRTSKVNYDEILRKTLNKISRDALIESGIKGYDKKLNVYVDTKVIIVEGDGGVVFDYKVFSLSVNGVDYSSTERFTAYVEGLCFSCGIPKELKKDIVIKISNTDFKSIIGELNSELGGMPYYIRDVLFYDVLKGYVKNILNKRKNTKEGEKEVSNKVEEFIGAKTLSIRKLEIPITYLKHLVDGVTRYKHGNALNVYISDDRGNKIERRLVDMVTEEDYMLVYYGVILLNIKNLKEYTYDLIPYLNTTDEGGIYWAGDGRSNIDYLKNTIDTLFIYNLTNIAIENFEKDFKYEVNKSEENIGKLVRGLRFDDKTYTIENYINYVYALNNMSRLENNKIITNMGERSSVNN